MSINNRAKKGVLGAFALPVLFSLSILLWIWPVTPAISAAFTMTLQYDDLNRLGGVTFSDQSSVSYDYDEIHNRTQMTVDIASAPPVAVDDEYSGPGESPFSVPMPGVLSNDFDVNHDALMAVLDTDTTVGTVDLRSDGSFMYTPLSGFRGTVNFTYVVEANGDQSNIATVTLTIHSPDTDGDGMSDDYENAHSLDPDDPSDALLDPDQDGLTNLQESERDTNPHNWDTDGDDIRDGADRKPLVYANDCLGMGTDIFFHTIVVLDDEHKTCAAQNSIETDASVDVQAGGSLELIAPMVFLGPGFRIPTGGALSVISADPGITTP